MVDSYALYMDDNEVANLTAGNDAVLKVTLKNNAAKNAIYKTVATLKLSDSNSLILTAGYADAAYVRSIPAGQTAEIEYHISARASAAVGPSAATITLTYETSENEGAVAGNATSTIQIPIKQEMDLQIDTPVVYGTPGTGRACSGIPEHREPGPLPRLQCAYRGAWTACPCRTPTSAVISWRQAP